MSNSPLAIIPARVGSKGILRKNFTPLAGSYTPVNRAVLCALDILDGQHVVVSTDDIEFLSYAPDRAKGVITHPCRVVQRPPELAQDDTPMIDVVKHVLAEIPGDPMQPILLIQPTQPLREPKHLQQALALLTPEVDSVVSVVETVSADELLYLDDEPGVGPILWCEYRGSLRSIPTRRQEMRRSYKRDGTVYAFWRKTLDQWDNIYGDTTRPLIIDPSETCPLDTPADWREAERRLHARSA